jgi:antitoxin component of MazEF toxin-antitoxin module
VRRKVFSIAELVRRIRADNLHDPIDTGPPAGREIW